MKRLLLSAFLPAAFISLTALALSTLSAKPPVTLRTPAGVLTVVSEYSGGESGCCMRTTVAGVVAGKPQSVEFETNAAGDSADTVNAGKEDFLRITDESYYGHTATAGCRFLVAGGVHEGISELRLFRSYSFQIQNGKLTAVDVTARDPGLPDVLAAFGKNLSARSQTTYNAPDADLAGILQYVKAMSSIGKKNEALALLRGAKLSIMDPCDKKGRMPLADLAAAVLANER